MMNGTKNEGAYTRDNLSTLQANMVEALHLYGSVKAVEKLYKEVKLFKPICNPKSDDGKIAIRVWELEKLARWTEGKGWQV